MQEKVLIKEGVIESMLVRMNKNKSWLSRAAEIDPSYLNLLLKQDRNPSPAVRERLMECLEVTDWDALFELINDIDETPQPMPT